MIWRYEFKKKRNDVKFPPIKEKLVNIVLKTDDGYKIIWYLGSTGYNSKLRNCFILECQFTIKQFASLATL